MTEATQGKTGRPAGRGFIRSQLGMLLTTVLVVGLGGLAAVPWILSSPERMSRYAATLLPQLQGTVTFGSVRLGWSGPMTFDDVRIVPRDGSAAPVRIKRIVGSHGLLAMLASGGDLGEIRVEGLEADVVYDAERQSNLATLFPPAAEPAVGSAGATGGPRRSPVRLRLDVDGAIVRIAGPWSPEQWVSDPISVRAALAPAADAPHSEWTIEPVQLLADARLEPGVAQGVLAYIAPVLADATRTGGRFSLRLDGARLPVGEPAAGTLAGRLSMHEVVLGPGPLAVNVLQSLPLKLPPPPAILFADEANVDFRLADRRVWHKGLEFGLPLAKPGQRLDVESSGSVGLDDGSLDLTLRLPIPGDLPQDRPLLAALAGKQVSVGISGVLGEPKVVFDGSIKAAAGGVLADFIDNIRNRPRPAPAPGSQAPPRPQWQPQGVPRPGLPQVQQPATPPQVAQPGQVPAPSESLRQVPTGGDPTAEQVIDLVGGVLDEVAKRRAERRAAEAANPEAVPPRRGGLLRRLAPPRAEGSGASEPVQQP
jgi:hypothetical protein